MSQATAHTADPTEMTQPKTYVPTALTSRNAAIACCLVALLLSWLLAILSDGVHHDDDLTHFLYAKWSGHRLAFLLNEWGRPGFTVLYFLPSQLGWTAARMFSGLLSVAAAWWAFRTAEEVRLPWAWLAAPLALIQPMFFQLSYTTLTETAVAFYVTLAMLLLVRGRFALSAAVLSLTLVTRYECVVWLPLWVVAMWFGRARWRDMIWLLWAPIAYNVITYLWLGHVPFDMFFEPKANTDYGRGTLLAMPARALLAFGPGIIALAAVGIPATWPKRWGWFVAGVALLYFAFHVFCRYLGLYATGGYPRFLISISPIVGVLALAGARELACWTSPRWPRAVVILALTLLVFWYAGEAEKPDWIYPPFVWAFRLTTFALVFLVVGLLVLRSVRPRPAWWPVVLPMLLIGTTLIQTRYMAKPWMKGKDQWAVASVVTWLKEHGYGDRPILATNVWVYRLWPMRLQEDKWHVAKELEAAPPGTILIWDKCYSPSHPHAMDVRRFKDDPNYRLLTKSWPSPGVFCYAFEKVGAAEP